MGRSKTALELESRRRPIISVPYSGVG